MNTKQKEAVIKFCQEMIKIRSLSQEEKALAEAVRQYMLSCGYDEAWIDEMGNVIGQIGSGKGPVLLFDGHLDTVGVTDSSQWLHDPYGAEIEGGRLYGRGASDMKGALAAMVTAVGLLASVKGRLKGTVYVSGTVCEELVEGPGLGRVIEQVHPDFVVIGEATNLKLCIGQRGRGEIILETFGKPAHSSSPQMGINAVEKMAEFYQVLKKIPLPNDKLLGPAMMELTDIISRPYPGISVIPDLCRVTFDRRLLVGETAEEVLYQIEKVIEDFSKTDSAFKANAAIAEAEFSTYTGYRVVVPKFAPAWKIEENHPLVLIALEALRGLSLSPEIGAYSFCTNGSYSAGKFSIPTIGFGPGNENQAHTVNEFLEIEDMLLAAAGYYAIALAICGES